VQVTWRGKIVGISDGETITALKDRTLVKIRFYGIDTPEGNQAFDNKVTNQIKKYVSCKTVEVTIYDTDRYATYLQTHTIRPENCIDIINTYEYYSFNLVH